MLVFLAVKRPLFNLARIWANLVKQGIQIGAHDLTVGSTALALGFSAASFNVRHFDKIDGLKLELLS